MFHQLRAGLAGVAVFLMLGFTANAGAASWVRLSPPTSPPGRFFPMMAYDPVSQKIVLFGGEDTGYFGDTWTFDGTTWTQLHPALSPSARSNTQMAYDKVTHQLVLFGGWSGANYLGDTWLWDGATSNWTQANPSSSPPPMVGALIFTDPTTGHVAAWGGWDGHHYQSKTWRWTGTTWKQLKTANTPSGRACSTYGLDPKTKSVVMFGGLADSNPENTWIWDGRDWTEQNPEHQLSVRYCGAGAFDPKLHGVVSFGGGVGGPDLGDTWVWLGTDWLQLDPRHSPPPREAMGMAFDVALGRVIVFGGLKNSRHTLDDTWELRP